MKSIVSKLTFIAGLLLAAGVAPVKAQFTAADVGNPAVVGSTTTAAGGFTVNGAGSDIGGTNDQFHFNYQSYAGDFDVKVRVESLSFSDIWAKAGLVARENLSGGSRYAGAFATPNISGDFFQYRTFTAGQSTNAGSFPATYPNTWLRLKRTGNAFTGYAGVDGNSWMQLGAFTLATPPAGPMLVGMAVTSRATNQAITAQFRGFENVTGTPVVMSQTLSKEPLGPSSRATGLVISEVMFHPRTVGNFTNNSLEFVEIFNSQSYFEDIGNYRLSGAIEYTFPPNTVMQPGTFLVIARDPGFVQSHYGISGVLGPWDGVGNNGISTNGLPGGSGRVRLRNPAGAVLLEVNYQGGSPWPIAADGAGHSLVLARASYGEGDVKAWDASDTIDGSPGRVEPFSSDPLGPVVINEFLAHTDEPLEDFIELYNHSNQDINLSGAYLTDEGSTNKFRIPNGTSIPARGFVSFNQTTLGFSLGSTGERIFLVNSNQNRVIDALDFGPQENGVSTGRYPDGAPTFFRMAERTAGAPNSGQRNDSIVINEIMFSPITGDSDDEYVELYNRGNAPVNVGNWRFVAGINFTIPHNTVIASNGYLVIARKASRLLANYSNLNTTNTVGDFSGTLANGGERIALAMPDYNVTTNNNVLVTNVSHIVVNEVTYGSGGRWGNWADGGGSSLELKDPRSDNRQPASWADSDETDKGIWTTIEVRGNIGETLGSPINDNLQIFLLGIGECLVDDVEVRNFGGANLIGNNFSFETGLTGWTPQGSHDHSTIKNEGFTSASSLHLRAASRGDNGANRIRSPGLTGVASTNVLLRCRAKWMRGWPELLLTLHGGGLEVGGRLKIQPNLGTPGAVNSRAVPNAGPAIYDVVHTPILPAASEAVVVTARASDPDTGFSLALKYRVEPAVAFSSVAMVDNGTAGDSIANDGLYSATIPAQPTGATVAFYVEGTDSLGAVNTFPQELFPIAPMTRVFPFDAPSRECVIRWGDRQMPGSLGIYRLWLNNTNTSRWTTRRPKLNNSVLDGTFVYNNYRVIYNMRPSFAGSPWHRGQMDQGPAGTLRCDYDIEMPVDDQFLGVTDLVWNNPGNPGGDSTTDTSAQSEQTSYQIFKEIGVHYNYRRHVHVFVNGSQRSTTSNRPGNFIFEDSQQANGAVIKEWFPDDSDGTLLKIEDWFWFPDNGDDFSGNNDADLTRRTTFVNGTTNIHTGANRFMWRMRSRGTGESAIESDAFNDMLNLVSPASNPTGPINLDAVDSIIDYEQWMRVFACQHAVGNWDSYGFDRGKNGYAYKGQNGKFNHWTWDIDFTMGIGGNGVTDDLFAANDPRIVAMRGTSAGNTGVPAIRRAYWRAFQDIVNGPLNNAFMDPILDAKAASLAANNVNYDPALVATMKSYIAGRRNYLLTRAGENVQSLGNVAFTTTGTNFFSTNSDLVTISGTAAIGIKDIYFNGVRYPITWTSISNWTARVVLVSGTNLFAIQGYDGKGKPVSNASRTNAIVFTGAEGNASDFVVINEIMSNPLAADAEFVELFNTSSNLTFNLSGFQFNGLDYTFPSGSFIAPRTYLVLVKDRAAFSVVYGSSIPVFGQFSGNLQSGGETITLIKPGATAEEDVVIDKVRYEGVLPWPVGTNGIATASSIQLIDAKEDNSRPLNWSTFYVPAVYGAATNFAGATNGGWRRGIHRGLIQGPPSTAGTNFLIFLGAAGDVYLDDLVLVQGTEPEVGENVLLNGDFESELSPAWSATGTHSNTVISTTFSRSGNGSMHVIASGAGAGFTSTIRQFIPAPLTNNTPYTLSYWFYSTDNSTALTLRTTPGSSFTATTNAQVQVIPPFSLPPPLITPAGLKPTPGSNNTDTASLVAIPPLWLNELQAQNTTGPADNAGEREPWIELYNAGTNALDLSAYYLADNYDTNLVQWPFPVGATIEPGQFKIIWADGEPGETTAAALHTSFRLAAGSGTVALVRVVAGQPQVLDYLTYTGVAPGFTYGDYPDGQPFNRVTMRDATPGTNNIARPFNLYINEWLAGNTNTIADAADGQYEDWFEIYNPGTNAVDLGGLWLGDSSNSRYQVPTNGQYVIPAGGHLLVWADNEPNQNSPTRDLHVNFQLGKTADTITLYAADRSTIIDSVSFTNQVDDISQGRYPDGSLDIMELAPVTPRSANLIPGANSAPVLAAIGTRSVTLGQTLNFTLTATDAQVGQTLTYSILSGAPAGATLSAGGVFTWNTALSLVPATHQVTVQVADNGTPSMTDTETFTLLGLPPPPTIGLSGGQITIGFRTIPGKTYRVEYNDDLNTTPWQRLNNQDYVAAGASLVVQDNIGANPQRFYRIVQLD